jgi:hypothetical protein
MAERTKADGNGDGEESAAAALGNVADGGSAATPISAARGDESGTNRGEQEVAKPLRTAADIVAENKARKAAEDEAAAKARAEGPAAATVSADSSATATAAKVSTATATRPALTAAGQGLNRVRNLIASVVWLVAVLCAAVLALGALFTALSQTNESNEIVQWVLARGEDLVGPFGDLFKLETAKNTLLVNWGIAALAYLVVGKIAERIIRP